MRFSQIRQCSSDPGPVPFVTGLKERARKNRCFRRVLWTGAHLQLTVMEIPPGGDIGLENHPETDQMLRVEAGQALVRMGQKEHFLLRAGDAVLVPCGTWHNVINTGNCPLKLSSIYAPPQHPRGAVHPTKKDDP